MKYDIIYDGKKYDSRWIAEKALDISNILFEFCKEYAEEYNKQPENVSVTLGLEVWKFLTNHPRYRHSDKTFSLYNLEIPIAPDWTVHPNYIELNLE